MNESILEIVLKARDEASKTIENMGGEIDKAAKRTADLSQAFKAAGAIITGIGVGGVFAMKNMIDAAAESQKVMAQTEAVLKSTATARIGVNEQVLVGTKQVANATKGYAMDVREADAKLADMTKRMKDAKNPTESQKIALEKQRIEVDKLHGSATKAAGVYKTVFNPAMQITAEEVKKTADSLAKLTTFDDDVILSAENMLLTFTNIGKKTMPTATAAVLDMAQALGEDTQSAAMQLGKALNDPIAGVTALQRVGVKLTDTQKKQVETLMKHNDVMGAQKIILNELSTEFGGSAAAAAKTYDGQMKQASKAVEDLKKAIGKELLPEVMKMVSSFTGVVTKLSEMNPKTITTITNILKFGTVFALIAGPMLMFVGFLPALIAGFGAVSTVALPLVLILAGVAAIAFLIYTHWNQVIAIFNRVKPVIDNLTKAFTKWVKDNQETFNNFFEVLKGLFTFALGFLLGFWSTTWNAIKDLFASFWLIIKGLAEIGWGAIQIIIDIGMGIFTGKWDKAWEGIKQGWATIWKGMGDLLTGWATGIVNTIKLMIDGIIGVLNGLISGANAVMDKVPGNKNKIPTIPKFEQGGFVPKTGLAIVHEGEFVLSKDMIAGKASTPSTVNQHTYKQPINVYATVNQDIDLNILGQKLAFAMRNSR